MSVCLSAHSVLVASDDLLVFRIQDLIVGWADNIRHLQLVYTSTSTTDKPGQTSNGRTSSGDADIRARLIADWDLDCMVCGVSSFDGDHILVLGYMPPEDDCGGSEYSEMKAEGVCMFQRRHWIVHNSEM